MKYYALPFLLCWVVSHGAYSQIAADCDAAQLLVLDSTLTTIEVFSPPAGSGVHQEIVAPHHSPHFFHQEHHTAWYQFVAPVSGSLSLNVHPFDPSCDYDFILWRAKDDRFCELLRDTLPRPLRSVISRNDLAVASETGMAHEADGEHVPEGPNPSFVHAAPIVEGQRYYLVLDNVYGQGRGHRLTFSIGWPLLRGQVVIGSDHLPMPAKIQVTGIPQINSVQTDRQGHFTLLHPLRIGQQVDLRTEVLGFEPAMRSVRWGPQGSPVLLVLYPRQGGLQGIVRDAETLTPIGAQMTLLQGDEVLQTLHSDSISGSYFLIPPDSGIESCTFLVKAAGYFDRSVSLPTDTSQRRLDIRLFPNRPGAKLVFEDIRFHGGVATFLPSSRPSLNELLGMMQTHPTLRILIHGHVNIIGTGEMPKSAYSMTLSRKRALAVQHFLLNAHIDKARIRIKWHGGLETISYSDPGLNRRVEIEILENEDGQR